MTILHLHPTETAESDMWRLIGHDTMGPRLYEADLELLAEGLSRAARAHRLSRQADLQRAADDLTMVSSRLGLNRVARVARSVRALAAADPDPVALAATVARLERLGRQMLNEIWMLRDMPG